MNEYVVDYEPENYRNKIFYNLPNISKEKLQKYLINGMETSSREDGVFKKFCINIVKFSIDFFKCL